MGRLRPQSISLDLASTGHVMFIVAFFFAVPALSVLLEEFPVYVCSENCNEMRLRGIRDLIAMRDTAAPYLDVAFALAVLGAIATTAGTVRSVRRSRPTSAVAGALGIVLCYLATVVGFGLAAGYRWFVPDPATTGVLLEQRLLGQAWDAAITGLSFFLVVGVLSLLAFAASYAQGQVRRSREVSLL
jgi:hypothetical protein